VRALGRRAFFTTGLGSVADAVASDDRSIDATVESGSTLRWAKAAM
jgi:hypothetical protein